MPVLGGRVLPALMLVAITATAGAQQKACEIDEGSPNQVARAKLDLGLSQSSQKPEDVAKKLQDAVKLLGEGEMNKNPTGRAFVLGQTLVLWLQQPSVTNGMSTRGAIGFQDNPTAPYDVIGGIDSAFKVVETAMPECVSQTQAWRQQKGWVDLVNHAIELSNGGKTDSAIAVAKRSIQLSPFAPYGYMVLAQAAAQNNQAKDAIGYYKQAIEAASRDTAQAETKRQLLNQLGNLAADAADAATGADKQTYIQEAKDAFNQLAKDPGTKYADAAAAGLAKVATASGDTAAIKASYAAALANPSAMSYNALMQAAVTAAKVNQDKDAIKLFEAAKAVNPYHRDVLYNLSRLYLLDSAYDKGIPLAKQLITVDPSNPDNYQLLAIAYASVKHIYDAKEKTLEDSSKALGKTANTSRSPKVVRAAVDAAAKLAGPLKAYADSSRMSVDSALKYNDLMTKLPARVSFTEFTPGDAKATVGGNILNQTDAPKTYTLHIEFLDKTGTVVTTQDVSVGPVAPHESGAFKGEGTGAGIVAFRYAPIN
ncbi:MAG TPA: tetratricopeptide repeat protein [Gemmatimonadaceae bacterium]|nr:tetratricopeptide repeat protein [Gemmatimonadaceae bacterium]